MIEYYIKYHEKYERSLTELERLRFCSRIHEQICQIKERIESRENKNPTAHEIKFQAKLLYQLREYLEHSLIE